MKAVSYQSCCPPCPDGAGWCITVLNMKIPRQYLLIGLLFLSLILVAAGIGAMAAGEAAFGAAFLASGGVLLVVDVVLVTLIRRE